MWFVLIKAKLGQGPGFVWCKISKYILIMYKSKQRENIKAHGILIIDMLRAKS